MPPAPQGRLSSQARRIVPAAILLFAFSAIALDFLQARRAAFVCPSDQRNPLAYVPTSTALPRWTARNLEWLRSAGVGEGEPIAVVGAGYWPLPWYLRHHPTVGYWPSLPEIATTFPMIVAMPEAVPDVSQKLSSTHQVFPEGLRTDTPVLVFLRNDIWEIISSSPLP